MSQQHSARFSYKATLNADSTLAYVESVSRRTLRKSAAVVGLGVYAIYLIYRGLYTLNPDALAFSLAVYLAEIHGFFSLAFYYFQIWELRRRNVPPPPEGVSVDVFITTCNEDVDLLRQTVRGAINMRYPHRTFVLDDGRRPEVRALCEELGCEYVSRDTNEHAKAGNWNHAYARTSGALIATFDADHVPRADFLERTLGFFADPWVGVVQVPQRYHNLDSLQHRVDWRQRRLYGEQDVFFNLVMPGKDHWNASFFCGTGAVLRRSALAPHGGLVTGTITEDMHTALALQSEGWKSVYLNELLVTGLAPMDFTSYSSQRLRWAEGNLKIIRQLNPLTRRGLTFAQRVCYFASMYHWTIGFPKLVFYVAPPLILFSGQFPIANFDRPFVTMYLAHLAALVGSYKLLARGTGRLFMDELFNMANFYTLLVALWRFLAGGRGRFVVTSKRGGEGGNDRALWPHYALVVFTVLAIVWSALGLGFGVTEDVVGAGVAAFWSVYNLSLMLVVLSFARRPLQKRQAVRFRASVPVELLDAPANGWLGVTLDLSETGCTLLWPRPLLVGGRLRLRLHLGAHPLDCDADIVSLHDTVRSEWVAYGVRFRFTGTDGADRLADRLYNMAVPEIFTRLTRPSWSVRVARAAISRVLRTTTLRAPRYEAYLPLRLQIRDGGEFLATTRDLSRGGLSLVSPRPLATGTVVRLILRSPDGEWSSLGTVMRTTAMPGADAAFRAWLVGLRIDGQADVVGLRHILSTEALA